MKFSPSVMVWGGITARGLTKFHIIPNRTSINSTYHIKKILEKEVKPAFQRTVVCTDLTATKLFSGYNNLNFYIFVLITFDLSIYLTINDEMMTFSNDVVVTFNLITFDLLN